MARASFAMNHHHAGALRHLRRSAGLTQDDVAKILGCGGRSYVAMLEAGDRVPHVRDTVILAMLFGTKEPELFPHLYSITRESFTSNVRGVIKEAIHAGEPPDSERIRFLRDALTSVELDGNVEPQAV